jgi:O-antigen ligase
VLSAALSFSGNLVSSVTGKIQDFVVGEGVRALTYAQLVTDIAESPLGIGKGRFVETNNFSWLGQGVYPHNNLLGIGAELGVPALVLFVGFLLSAAIRLVRHGVNGRGRLPEPLRMVAVAALAMLVYQQFRGLLQDTWVIRETYFWVGLGLGTLSQRLDHSTASEYQRGS